MSRIITMLLLLAGPLLLTTVQAQQSEGQTARTVLHGAARRIEIWNNATAPHSNGIPTPEREPYPNRLYDVSTAELFIYPADSVRAADLGVVICPGGGYRKLCIDYEGYDMARWFAANGITAAVLKYRLPNGNPEVPLEDAEQALRILSGLATGADGCTARRVGVVGSSAGGHLAAALSTLGDVRPAFTILFYPVIASDAVIGHKGSFDRLLGPGRTAAEGDSYSPEMHVDANTPPAILFLSDDDAVVDPLNSVRYYEALRRHGVKASMHIYPTGGHGWGIRDGFPYREAWQQTVLAWLRTLGGPDGR